MPLPLVPPGPVTVTGTVPVPGGTVTVICVWAELMVKGEATLLPNRICLAPLKLEPLMVTWIPEGPDAGLTTFTSGAVDPVWSGVTVGDVCTIDWLDFDPSTWLPAVLDMTPSQPAPATAIAVTAAAAGAADPCRRCSALRTSPLIGASPRSAPPKGTLAFSTSMRASTRSGSSWVPATDRN